MKLKYRILTIVMSACMVAMGLSSVLYYLYGYYSSRSKLAKDMLAQAMVVGENCRASLAFGDSEDAANTLRSLQINPEVIYAAIYTQYGEKLAEYVRQGGARPDIPYLMEKESVWYDMDQLRVIKRIDSGNEAEGYVYLVIDTQKLEMMLRRNMAVFGGMSLAALLVALVVAIRLQKIISEPILKLAEKADDVSRFGNYEMDPVEHGDDEVGALVEAFGNMLHEVREREEALKSSEEQFRTLFEASNDAIVLIDGETIVACNRSAIQQFKAEGLENVVSRTVHEFSLDQQPDGRASESAMRDYLQTAQREGGCRFEWEFMDMSQTAFYADVFLSPVTFKRKQILQAVIRDISERRRHEEALQEAREEAVRANSAKSDFLARMSHEIRTPMNGVVGMLDLLRKTGLHTRQEHYVQVARSSAASLLTLINDILDFSKIEAGKLELDRIDFSMTELLGDVVDVFSHRVGEKGLELMTYMGRGVPQMLHGDPVRIRQNLINLIGNALKFTQEGGIRLEVEMQEADGRGGLVRFQVSDTGIGIPADRLESLFSVFVQADTSTTRKYGGTGLGLSITKSLAELMGGGVGVTSEEGKGSTFWFTARLEAAQQLESEMETERFGEGLSRLRVLVADRNGQVGEMLKRQMESWDCEVQAVNDREGALGLAGKAIETQRPYDVILIGGKEFVEQLAGEEALGRSALIALTEMGECDRTEKYLRSGIRAVLHKPIAVDKLYQALLRVVRGEVEQERETMNTAQEAVDRDRPRIQACILMAEDNEINQEVAQEIITQAGHQLDIVNNGQEALEQLRVKGYHLVLMDCSMPVMDGFEATRQLRQVEALGKRTAGGLEHIPVVALTANAIKGDRERCLEAGMDDYLTKPFNPEVLLKVIDMYSRQSEAKGVKVGGEVRTDELSHEPEMQVGPEIAEPSDKQKEVRVDEREIGEAKLTGPSDNLELREPDRMERTMGQTENQVDSGGRNPINFDQFYERCMKNPAFFEKMLTKFADRAQSDLAQIVTAAEHQDEQQLALLAHALKGAASNLSAAALQEAAAELERKGKAGEMDNLMEDVQQLQQEVDRCLSYIERGQDYLKTQVKESD